MNNGFFKFKHVIKSFSFIQKNHSDLLFTSENTDLLILLKLIKNGKDIKRQTRHIL